MASRGTRGNGTTHNSRPNGHGQTIARRRFAIPTTGLVRGAPVKSKTAPWYLKWALSRPESKRRRSLEMVA